MIAWESPDVRNAAKPLAALNWAPASIGDRPGLLRGILHPQVEVSSRLCWDRRTCSWGSWVLLSALHALPSQEPGYGRMPNVAASGQCPKSRGRGSSPSHHPAQAGAATATGWTARSRISRGID